MHDFDSAGSSPYGTRGAAGFTLIELMITVVVVGLLTTVGIPSLAAFVKNSAMRGTAYALMADLATARTEAIKRSGDVVLCRSANPTAYAPSCGGSSKDWTSGWLVFVSKSGATTFTAGTDILVATGRGSSNGVHLRTNSAADANLVFRAGGGIAAASTAEFVLCDDRGAGFGKQISVNLVGRPDLVAGTLSAPLGSCSPP